MIFRLRNQDKNSLICLEKKKKVTGLRNSVRDIHIAIKKDVFNLLSVSRQHCEMSNKSKEKKNENVCGFGKKL